MSQSDVDIGATYYVPYVIVPQEISSHLDLLDSDRILYTTTTQ
jgi:hypothetical protein